MPTVGSTSKPAYVYDAGTDTWIPIGPGEHSHAYIPNTLVDAKGDIIAATGADAVSRLAVGANGTTLVADSGETTGLKWATPAGAKNFTLVNAGGTALTGAQTITVSGISGADQIFVYCTNVGSVSGSSELRFRFNGDDGSNYVGAGVLHGTASNDLTSTSAQTGVYFGKCGTSAGATQTPAMMVHGANTSGLKVFDANSMGNDSGAQGRSIKGVYSGASAITSVSINSSVGNFDEGSIFVYTSA